MLTFVKRWYPETNVFHIPFGEMTITLDGVSSLLGILVVGQAISIYEEKLSLDDAVTLVSAQLGVSPQHAKGRASSRSGNVCVVGVAKDYIFLM